MSRPTANDVHSPGPMNKPKKKPIQKPWTASNVPDNLKEWPEAMRARFAEVATRVLEETNDEEKAVQAGIAAAMRLKKMGLEKANHAYAKCMLCKESPPDNDALWQDEDGGLHRAWTCSKCFPTWYAEKGQAVIHVYKVEGVAPSRYKPIRHSPKEKRGKRISKDTLLKVNGQVVTVGDLGRAWLAGQSVQVIPTEPQEEIEKQEVILNCEIIKADKKRHTITSVVLQPEKRDAQKDTVSEDDILDAIHGYMMKSRAIDYRHREVLPFTKAVPVEVYAAPIDFELDGHPVRKGAWVMTTKILDAELWKEVEKGKLRAYSIKGWGKRTRV